MVPLEELINLYVSLVLTLDFLLPLPIAIINCLELKDLVPTRQLHSLT